MKRIAIITEKLDVAKSMAQAMGWTKTGKGFEGTFEGCPVVVQHARGHLLTLESPDAINPELGWNNPTGLVPLPKNVNIVPIKEEKKDGRETAEERLGKIARAIKEADEVILATDSDREGEYIGWLILEYLGFKGSVRRCWLAEGMDEISMKKAMSNLLPCFEKKSLARAAEARARCDWMYMFMVRLLTYYGRHGVLGNHLGRGSGRESVVSVGRVQSAALYMIYKREQEIRNFVPKTFYRVLGEFDITGTGLDAEYSPRVTRDMSEAGFEGVTWEPQGLPGENKPDKPLFTGKAQVDAFQARLKNRAADAKVIDYTEGSKELPPPITYDLVAAKAELSKLCKISGDVAQAVIEDLYEQGFISYPRTAHGELPNNLYEPAERDVRLKCIMGVPGLGDAARKALAIHTGQDKDYKPFKPKVFVSKKLEHHGLIPSNMTVTPSVLAGITARKRVNNKLMHNNDHMREAYRLIAESYVRALLPPVRQATQRIVIGVPVEGLLGDVQSQFVATAARTVDSGWKSILQVKEKDATELPRLTKGTPSPLTAVKLNEGQTKKPGRYSESNFETALQKAAREVNDPELRKYLADGTNKPEGIGTPATRKDIVPTILVRGYISSQKGQFFLEPKGQEYIDFQMKNGHHWLYRIETTAEWEGRLSDMTALEDDQQAMVERDKFVEDTLANIEGYINWMNERFANTELKELPREASRVSDKMKLAIKSICARKGIKPPSGTLSDPKKASEFLNEHAGQQSSDGSPSEAQLGYLAKVEQAIGVKATEEERKDRALLSAFLDKHKSKMDAQFKAAPPSEGMIKFARDIASRLPEDQKPDSSVFERSDACRAFLDKHTKKGGSKTGGGKSGGSARQANGASRKGKR